MKEYVIEKEILKHNIKVIKERAKGVPVCGIVKCNGYGMDLVPYAKFLLENGIDLLGTSTVEEALILRQNKIESDILLLTSYSDFNDCLKIVENNLIATVGSKESAYSLDKAGKELNIKPLAHIELNTGMGRCGFDVDKPDKILPLKKLEISFCGTFTHFSFSFAKKPEFVEKQRKKFEKAVEFLNENGFETGVLHAANSSAFLKYKNTHFDMVRAGSALLGRIEGAASFGLKRVGYLKSKVIETNTLKKGENIGYANTFKVKRDTKTAIIPIGYADGFMVEKKNDAFRFSDILRYIYNDLKPKKYFVEINGKKAQILGRVGMFNIIADVTELDVKAGDTVKADANPILTDSAVERKYI